MITKNSRHKWWLAGILGVAVFLRFWQLGRFGLQHDAALNSARALGWFDFLVGVGQTGPLVWFGHIPWWANLSFHDHPPLSFALQKVFFFLFGESSLVALLPFVLAGVLAVWVVFRLVKEQVSLAAGLWTAAVLAVSSYAVWSARSGYLEGLLILWITLSLYFFLKFRALHRNRDLYFCAIAIALALLTKYTAIFLLPSAGLYLLFKDRRVFVNPHFWLAALLFLALLTPVVVYNAQVYLARGHFDAALSSMVGMSPGDYSVLAYRSLASDPAANFTNIFFSVARNTSLPMALLFAAGFLHACWQLVVRRSSAFMNFLLVNVFWLFAMFIFSGAADRFVVIALPFLCLLAGVFLAELMSQLAALRAWRRWAYGMAGVILALEILFSLNTNVATRPFGKVGLAYTATRFQVSGFAELDRHLQKQAYGRLLELKRPARLDQTELLLKDREAVLFDERADWFERVWYVDRYKHYYKVPIIYFTDLNAAIAASPDPKQDFVSYLRRGGASGIWAVIAQGPAVSADADADYSAFMQKLDSDLSSAGVLEREIKDPAGRVVFKVFHFR